MFAVKLAVFLSTALVVTAQNENDSFLPSIKAVGDSLNDAQLQEVKAIASNPESSKQQVMDSLQGYFRNIGGDAEAKFNAVIDQFKAKFAKIQEKVDALKPSMDEETKQMLAKVGDIHKDMSISFADERNQLKALFDFASPELKAKIEATGIFNKISDFAKDT